MYIDLSLDLFSEHSPAIAFDKNTTNTVKLKNKLLETVLNCNISLQI